MMPYAFFVQTCREEHRKKNPEQSVNFAEFSKKCSERWKGLSASDKKCFEDMAKADKVRYNREMRDYVPPKGFGKRGRKRKDPNAPKRPPSAFFVFCSEYRPSVKQQYPGLSIGDCAKKLGEMWSKLTQSEKQPYEEKAQKLREKYDRDMVAYRGGGSYAARNPDSSAQGGEEEEEDEGEEEEEEEEDDE
uniref:High mobility group protein B2 n=1 Tax=Takifugu rubripes TaxID=31033 RepID=A0A674MGX2_TAKRU